MKSGSMVDTIAAISTAVGEGGIGIVRLSGPDAVAIAAGVFLPKEKKKVMRFKTYTLHYGWVVEDDPDRTVVDEAILSLMRSPKSYTKEDVVEINCHGGIVPLRRTLELVLEKGARLAEPGEFTKRAFLNGRLDLTQAEAVLDIIRAKTDYALKVSAEQLSGVLSGELRKIREGLIEALADLEAGIDFPEEGLSIPQMKKTWSSLKSLNNKLLELLKGCRASRLLREGLSVTICGKANVGKSSLLNALLKRERALVTPVPGTTRDTLEESMDIKGVPVKIIDTAGILKPRGMVEHKALKRSRGYMESSDLVILLFDASRRLSVEDFKLIRSLKNKEVIPAINKTDLKERIEKEKIIAAFGRVIEISAKKNRNIGLLEDRIAEAAYSGRITVHEASSVSSLRHIQRLKKAQKFVAEALDSVDNNEVQLADASVVSQMKYLSGHGPRKYEISTEYVCQDLREALLCLDDVLGLRFSEDVLDNIFSNFCIGK